MAKTLILLRGIPGSGKSTIANALCESDVNAEMYEADMYFMKDGEYKFDQKLLGHAHDWCHMQASNAMKYGINRVIVANTFLKKWEMQEYIREALSYGYEIQVIDCQSTYHDVHGVPEATLDRMKKDKEAFNLELFVKDNWTGEYNKEGTEQ